MTESRKAVQFSNPVAYIRHLLLSLAFLLICSPVFAEGLCESGDTEWEAIVQEYPDDKELFELYTLRNNLCDQVENREISYSEAVVIFEIERGILVEKRRQ